MKIRINELPDGFEIRDGQVFETKESGGSTGDQNGYGLVTGQQNEFSEDDIKVKHSMAPVPRDEANIEAEKGETVLTDLNNDGQYSLYNIQGKRHARGGTPLFLPEQSFVFSDFNKMKLTKEEMADMGMETKKRLTPAKVSKKFGTNEYYASIKDSFADDIQVKTAELMLDKNKLQLSKLAFLQESKKDFDEGVPISSFPYLVTQGHDPIEYKQKVEQITRQQAEQEYIQSLPPEKQMQIMAMKQYMAQVDQQQGQQEQPQEQGMQQIPPEEMQQGMQQGMPPQGQGMMPPPPDMNPQQMAQMGFEIQNDMPIAQGGGGFWDILKDAGTDIYNRVTNPTLLDKLQGLNDADKRMAIEAFKGYYNGDVDEMDLYNTMRNVGVELTNQDIIDSGNDPYYGEIEKLIQSTPLPDYATQSTAPDPTDPPDPTKPKKPRVKSKRPSSRNGDKRNVAYDDAIYNDFYKKEHIWFDPVKIDARKYKDVQSQKDEYYGDATDNIEGFYESWKDLYPGIEDLKKELEQTKGQGKGKETGKFQKWFNDEYITFFAKDWVKNKKEREYTDAAGNVSLTPEDERRMMSGMIQSLKSDFGFNDIDFGKDFDKKMGTFTSSRRPFTLTEDPPEVIETAKEYTPEDAVEEEDELAVEPGDFNQTYSRNDPRFWLQDLIKMNAVANRKRKKFYPWEPGVENLEVNWLLEDPTRAIAATNEQLGLMGESISSFAGPQSLNARMANAQGKAAANIANVIAGVHNRNINTTNKGLALQTQYDSYLNAERRKRSKSLYDNTQVVEQKYMDEKNFDREQMAGLVANAYTNAMNTYNLNSLNDYYNIDPSTGGAIGFKGGKPWDYSEQSESNYMDKYMKARKRYIDDFGEDPTQETMKQIMEGYNPTQTRADKMRKHYRDTNPLNVDNQGIGRRGKEIKHKLLPFFIGAIGI